MSLSQEQFDQLRAMLREKKEASPEKFSTFQQGLRDRRNVEQSEGVRGLAGFAVGAIKGGLSTARNLGKFGQRALQETTGRVVEGITGTPRDELGSDFFKDDTETGARIKEELTPEGTAENIGFTVERIAEFLLPSSKVASLSKGANLATRAAIEGTTAGVQTAIQQGDVTEDTQTAVMVGAAFPIAGAVLKSFRPSGELRRAVGEKIQFSILKPSQKDIKDGFKVANVGKYDVGGSVQETFAKSQNLLNNLTETLQTRIKDSDAVVDLVDVAQRTERKLVEGKARNFGDVRSVKRVVNDLLDEVAEVSEDGLVDLATATNVKRGAGTKGAWVFGMADKDASAVETVYTAFYRELREEIEKQGLEGIKSLNRQISELIPISNAALRRLPVEQRNNVLSLTDSIGLYAAAFDPKALALIGAQKLSRSGRFGQFLVRSADRAKQSKITTPIDRSAIGERVFGGDLSNSGFKGGFSIEEAAAKIGPVEREAILEFTDAVATRKVTPELAQRAQSVADEIGLGDAAFAGNQKLAEALGEVLEAQRQAGRSRNIRKLTPSGEASSATR